MNYCNKHIQFMLSPTGNEGREGSSLFLYILYFSLVVLVTIRADFRLDFTLVQKLHT